MNDASMIVDQDSLTKEEWLGIRRQGIGSSDAAVILGMSPWSSPWQIWLDKTGQVALEDEQTEAMYFGTLLEETIVKAVADRTGWQIRRPRGTYRSYKHPFMLASPDAIITMPDGTEALLEIKNTSGYKLEEWSNGEQQPDGTWTGGEAPAHYIIQVQHQHAVLGTTVGYIGALLGGNRLYIIRVDRDDDLIATLVEKEHWFWEVNVKGNQAPPVDASPSTTDLLAQLFAESNPDATLELDTDLALTLAEYQKASADEAAAKERKTLAGNILRNALGEAETATFDGVEIATWKPQATDRFDQKAFREDNPELYDKYVNKTSGRVLRIGRSKAAQQTLARIMENE